MASGQTIKGTFGWNNQPFVQAMQQAQQLSQTAGNRIATNLNKAQLRSGLAATGRYNTQYLRYAINDALRGNVIGSIENFGALSGSHKIAGAAVGIGVAGLAFEAIYESAKKAREESDALFAALTKANAVSGPVEYKTLGSITSQMKDIRETRAALLKSESSRSLFDIGSLFSELTDSRNAGSSPLDNIRNAAKRRDKAAEESFAAQLKAGSEIAQKYRSVVDIQETGLRVSERQGEIDKTNAAFQEKYGELIQAGPDQNPEAAAQLKRANKLDIEEINKKYDLLEKEQAILDRTLNLQESGLSKDRQSLAILRDKIGLYSERLRQPQTAEERAALGSQQHQLTNEQDQLLYDEKNKSPEQSAAERHQAQRYQQFVRGMTASSPSAYITSPDAYGQTGSTLPDSGASPDAYNLAGDVGFDPNGTDYQTPAFRSDLRDFKRNQDAFQGSDYFNQFFHTPPKTDLGGDGSGKSSGNAESNDQGGKSGAAEQILNILSSWDR